MSKQVKLTAIATAIVSNVNERIASELKAKELAAQCAKMGAKQKRGVDAELVTYYAAQAGVHTKEREKGEAKEGRCNLVAVWERDDNKKLTPASNRASVALSRARAILFPDTAAKKTAATDEAKHEKALNAAFKTLADAVKAGDETAKGFAKALLLLVKAPGAK
jgi:hypothetical protein